MDNYQFPKPGKTYISPSLPAFGGKDYRVRIASKVIESPDSYAFAKVKDEIVLRHREGAKTYLKAKFVEDNREIFLLNIQGYTVATQKPHNASFSFVGEEIEKLLEFIANIHSVTFKGNGSVNITDAELRRIALSSHQARNLVVDNEELFAEVVKSSITRQDVVAVGYVCVFTPGVLGDFPIPPSRCVALASRCRTTTVTATPYVVTALVGGDEWLRRTLRACIPAAAAITGSPPP
jgi:hypothetical protein